MASGQSHIDDPSNGWEAVADTFMAVRSRVGAATVESWARSLPPGSAVLDLGCGSGVPISEALMAGGCSVHGVDASPSLVAAFQRRFPGVPVVCEPVEESTFFDRTFDGVVAVGLVFLLSETAQRAVIRRVASALRPQGQFLFTAPVQQVSWADTLTGRRSLSLGAEAYAKALAEAGLTVIAMDEDEGGNHFYVAVRA